jgi:hypothetical protein
MEMRSISRKFRTWVKRLWEPPVKIDDFAIAEDLLNDTYFIDQQRLSELLAERERLSKAKKRASHLDSEINRLKAHQMIREAQS